MPQLNVSLDASFWINAYRGGLVNYLSDYFTLFVPQVVANEIERPSAITGLPTAAGLKFREWRLRGHITIQNPQQSVDWFHAGENAAIGLAIEQHYWLLIDNGQPYRFSLAQGLTVIKTPDLALFLFDAGKLSYQETYQAIHRLQINKKLARSVLIALEELARSKGVVST